MRATIVPFPCRCRALQAFRAYDSGRAETIAPKTLKVVRNLQFHLCGGTLADA